MHTPTAAAAPTTYIEPDLNVLKWINENQSNEFAQSLAKQYTRNNGLTEKQVAAVLRNLAPKQIGTVDTAGVDRITRAFESALTAGIKRPKLRLASYHLKPAKPDGKNPGAIYVMQDSVYLGKVAAGQFQGTRECTPEMRAEITTVCSDPLKAAVEYGMRTGECACCGRDLSNHDSLELGIGPICKGKWGF